MRGSAWVRTSTSRLVRIPRTSSSSSCDDAWSSARSFRARPVTTHARRGDRRDPGGARQAVVGELVEVAYERRRLDAHVRRELRWLAPSALAAVQHPSSEARRRARPAVGRARRARCGASGEQPSDRRFHSALMISTLMISPTTNSWPSYHGAARGPRCAPSPRAPWPRAAGRSTPPRGRRPAARTTPARGCGCGRPASTSVSSTWRSGRRRPGHHRDAQGR